MKKAISKKDKIECVCDCPICESKEWEKISYIVVEKIKEIIEEAKPKRKYHYGEGKSTWGDNIYETALQDYYINLLKAKEKTKVAVIKQKNVHNFN